MLCMYAIHSWSGGMVQMGGSWRPAEGAVWLDMYDSAHSFLNAEYHHRQRLFRALRRLFRAFRGRMLCFSLLRCHICVPSRPRSFVSFPWFITRFGRVRATRRDGSCDGTLHYF